MFSLLALALASCKDDKDETPAAKITVNEQVLAFDCEESAQDFTFESTLKWTIECGAADWLTVSPLEGKGGTVTVSVAVAANPSATPRSASFFIRSMAEQVEITVNQADDEGAHLLTFAEDFKAYLVENFDTDGDGEISRDEAELITAIECENLGLTSLEGVRNLTNLQTLHCSYNAIETLDVSGMTSLTELLCDHNLITDLNVSDCSSLVKLKANDMYNATTGGYLLATLNLKGCSALEVLECHDNSIGELDVTDCKALKDINQLLLQPDQADRLLELPEPGQRHDAQQPHERTDARSFGQTGAGLRLLLDELSGRTRRFGLPETQQADRVVQPADLD